MRETANRVFASAAGLGLLVVLVCAAAYAFAPRGEFWFIATAGLLFTVPFALYAWSGNLGKKKPTDAPMHPSWQDWVGIFFVGTALSALFIGIDVVIVHPGISLVFTLGTVALTFVALPGAMRAWLLSRFKSSSNDSPSDA